MGRIRAGDLESRQAARIEKEVVDQKCAVLLYILRDDRLLIYCTYSYQKKRRRKSSINKKKKTPNCSSPQVVYIAKFEGRWKKSEQQAFKAKCEVWYEYW